MRISSRQSRVKKDGSQERSSGFARKTAVGLSVASLALGLAACGSSSKTSSSSGGKTPACNGAAPVPPNNGGYPMTAAKDPVPSAMPAGMPGAGKPPINLGDKNFSEEYILGDLYQQALQSKGYTVNLKPNLGSSEITDKALTSGQIDMYPEYDGNIYTLLGNIGQASANPEATYAAAKAWEAKRGFTVLNPTPFQDADAQIVTKAFADKNGLKNIGDLLKLKHFTFGGPPENATRFAGVVGLKQAYCLNNMTFLPTTIGTQYTVLDQGKADTVAGETTDPQLNTGKYQVLNDNKGIYGFQNVVPVVANKLIQSEGPQFSQILDLVDSKLTFKAMVAMNAAVQVDQKDPAQVAGAFLKANGLT